MSHVKVSPPRNGLFVKEEDEEEEEEQADSDFGEFSSASPVPTHFPGYSLPAIKEDDRIAQFRQLSDCDCVAASNEMHLEWPKTFGHEIPTTSTGNSSNKCVRCNYPDPFANDVSHNSISQTRASWCNKQSAVDTDLCESELNAKVSYLSCELSEPETYSDVKIPTYHSNGFSSGFPVFELDEKQSMAVVSHGCFPHQSSGIPSTASVDMHDKSCEYDEFQSVLPSSDSCGDNLYLSGHQNNNWASFDDLDGHSASNDSWLAFQNNDEQNHICSNVKVPSCDVGVTKLESALSDLVALAFPNHADSLSDVKHNPVMPRDSCSPCSTTPLLLTDLIGSHTSSGSSREPSCSFEMSSSSSSTSTWNSLKVMEDTAALKFQWDGSHAKVLLLNSLAMESPTRLSARRIKKPSVLRMSQEVSDAPKMSCRQPYDASLSQTVLSISHLRM